MENQISSLKKHIDSLIRAKESSKRSMEHFKSVKSEKALVEKYRRDYVHLDREIGIKLAELKELENELYLQEQNAYEPVHDSKIEALIYHLEKESSSLSGNAIQRQAVQQTIEIIINALNQINNGD